MFHKALKTFPLSILSFTGSFYMIFLFFQLKKSKLLHLLDSIFSVFVVGTLVIIIWRSAWWFFDDLINLHDEILSAWASLVSITFMKNLLNLVALTRQHIDAPSMTPTNYDF